MSGGFQWSDERLGDVASVCMAQSNWAFRFVTGYRASLIRGAPRKELKPAWDQLVRECRDWPGLRPERSSADLAADLAKEARRVEICLRRLERRM
jgi:hypothetical protein